MASQPDSIPVIHALRSRQDAAGCTAPGRISPTGFHQRRLGIPPGERWALPPADRGVGANSGDSRDSPHIIIFHL